jgi:hypothetical protein
MTASKKAVEIGPALGYDPNFGGLDLSGCPSVQELPSSDSSSWIDPRFAPMDESGKGHGSNALKKFIAEHIAEQEGVSVVHVGEHKFRVFYRDSVWNADGTIAGTRYRYTAPDKDKLMGKLMQLARATTPRRGAFPELTEGERLHVARLAQSGDESAAFGQYFLSRIGSEVASMEDPLTELLSDPQYLNVCNEAAFFIWAAQNDSYIPDPEFEDTVARVAESKPLSGRLITSIWIEHLDARQKKDRSALLGQLQAPDEAEVADPSAIQRGLEDSSDAEIERLMRGTTREYAKQVRAGRL